MAVLAEERFFKRKNKQMIPYNKTIIVKVGTDALSRSDGKLDMAFLRPFTAQIAQLRLAGNRVIVVSSGAVGLGRALMRGEGWKYSKGKHLADKAAAAGFGQTILIDTYRSLFREAGLSLCAQFLVRNDDFSNGHVGARANILRTLSSVYAFPCALAVFNENDTVSYAENRPLGDDPSVFSDNDGLAALLADLVNADMSITASTHALHVSDPRASAAPLVPYVNFASATRSLLAQEISTEGVSACGSGGMENKVASIKSFVRGGVCGARAAYIVSVEDVYVGGILRAACDEPVGTKLVCTAPRGEPFKGCCACRRAKGRGPQQPAKAVSNPAPC